MTPAPDDREMEKAIDIVSKKREWDHTNWIEARKDEFIPHLAKALRDQWNEALERAMTECLSSRHISSSNRSGAIQMLRSLKYREPQT